MKVVRVLRKVDRLLGALETGGAVTSLGLILGLSLYQVVTRNVGWHAPSWVDPVIRQLVLWGGLLGATLAVRTQAHIRFDFVQPHLSGGTARAVQWVVSLAGAGVCLLLARASFDFVLTERGSSTTIAGIPGWVFPSVIPLSFVLMSVHFLFLPAIPAGSSAEPSHPGGGT